MRTAQDRVDKYVAKLIPSRVETVLTARLSTMRSSFGAAAVLQATEKAMIAAVLGGYDVSTRQYIVYYNYGEEVTRARRRFAGVPLQGQLNILMTKYLGRGLVLQIMEAVRDTLLAGVGQWLVDTGAGAVYVTARGGGGLVAVLCPTIVYLVNQQTKVVTSVATSGGSSRAAFAPVSGLLYVCSATGTVVDIVDPVALSKTSITLSGVPVDVCIDETAGFAWFALTAVAKIDKMALDTHAITAITVDFACHCVTQIDALGYVCALPTGKTEFYEIAKVANTIVVKTVTKVVGMAACDPVAFMMWIAGAGVSFMTRYNLAAATYVDVGTGGTPTAPVVDSQRGACWFGVPASNHVSRVLVGGTTATHVDVTACPGRPAVDPISASVYVATGVDTLVQRVHATALTVESIDVSAEDADFVAVDQQTHNAFVVCVDDAKLAAILA